MSTLEASYPQRHAKAHYLLDHIQCKEIRVELNVKSEKVGNYETFTSNLIFDCD